MDMNGRENSSPFSVTIFFRSAKEIVRSGMGTGIYMFMETDKCR